MVKIGIVGPGDFSNGWNSLVRGEGRWLMSILKSIKGDPEYDTTLISQDHGERYNYNDEGLGTKIRSIKAVLNAEMSFDILFSMDAFEEDYSGFHKTNMSHWISKIKTKQRIWTPFFSSMEHYNSKYPVVYPYYYKETDDKKLFTIPIALGTCSELNKAPNFNKKNAVWFSKNSHENPIYLYKSLKYSLEYINELGGNLVVVDGKWLMSHEYQDHTLVKNLITTYSNNIKLLDQWLPYDKMKYVLDRCKFICGIHHPIVNPMQLDIVFSGGIPIIFSNQASLPPFNDTHILFIDEKNVDNGLDMIYNKVLKNENSYNLLYYDLCNRAFQYTEETCKEEFVTFINKIKG
jgi:hypothetical protein